MGIAFLPSCQLAGRGCPGIFPFSTLCPVACKTKFKQHDIRKTTTMCSGTCKFGSVPQTGDDTSWWGNEAGRVEWGSFCNRGAPCPECPVCPVGVPGGCARWVCPVGVPGGCARWGRPWLQNDQAQKHTWITYIWLLSLSLYLSTSLSLSIYIYILYIERERER